MHDKRDKETMQCPMQQLDHCGPGQAGRCDKVVKAWLGYDSLAI